jgi:hypothetical protein
MFDVHTWVPVQPPQSSVRPQPSPIVPQYRPPPAATQVPGVQLVGAQVFATPAPPQVEPAGQSPHWSVPPQPSPIVPQ